MLRHGVVVERRLARCRVVVHAGGLLKGSRAAVAKFEFALTQVEPCALRQGVVLADGQAHQVDGALILAVVVVEHTHRVGRGAVNLHVGIIDVLLQVLAGLGAVALVVMALADHAVEFGGEVVVLPLGEQLLSGGNHLVVVLAVILDLCDVILRLIAQFARGGDGLEVLQRGVVVALGIVDIGVVEVGGAAVALCACQPLIERACLVPLAEPQVAIGDAVHHVLVHVGVQGALAHQRVTQQGIFPVAAVEVVVANLLLGQLGTRRGGVLLDERDQQVEALALAALKTAHGNQQLGLFFHVGGARQLKHVAQLVDGTNVVATLVHQAAALQKGLRVAVHHRGLRHAAKCQGGTQSK